MKMAIFVYQRIMPLLACCLSLKAMLNNSPIILTKLFDRMMIVHDTLGKPVLELSPALQRWLRRQKFSNVVLSLSYQEQAMVVALVLF